MCFIVKEWKIFLANIILLLVFYKSSECEPLEAQPLNHEIQLPNLSNVFTSDVNREEFKMGLNKREIQGSSKFLCSNEQSEETQERSLEDLCNSKFGQQMQEMYEKYQGGGEKIEKREVDSDVIARLKANPKFHLASLKEEYDTSNNNRSRRELKFFCKDKSSTYGDRRKRMIQDICNSEYGHKMQELYEKYLESVPNKNY